MAPSWLLALLPCYLVSGAYAATAGEFNILSMNVAGLPAILNGNDVPGDKATNAGTIGADFAKYDYDVIHVQEDFNYHAYIYATDDHPYRTATSGGAGFGSGLNTLANYGWIDFVRTKWSKCSDTDCLTPKGFTSMRIQLDTGVYIDFYNLHANAGTTDDDLASRAANVQQLADYIDENSSGNAVIVFGDTNTRYTRAEDNIRLLGTQNSLTDTWVELIMGGVAPASGADAILCDNPSTTNACETVDKVLYRGNSVIDLAATYWNYESEKFLQANGSVLTDHNPVTVNFTWTLSSSLRQSDVWGGSYGTWFSDLPSVPSNSEGSNKPLKLSFRGASRLDSVGLTLTSGTAYTHGGTGGTLAELTLGTSEYWTSAKLCQGQKNGETRNFYILATTSAGNTLSAGTETSDCQTSTAPDGWQIVGFFGQDGDEMDQLGFIYAPQ